MPKKVLPTNWTEEVDVKGRRFYSNEITQVIQWKNNLNQTETERPASNQPSYPREMPHPSRKHVRQARQTSTPSASQDEVHCKWTPRVTFWFAAAIALPVWILSSSAALDDNWFDKVSLSAFDEDILNECADDDVRAAAKNFCDLYLSFMVMQLDGTMLASVALALVTMAMFASASGCCCSVKVLGIGGAYALAVSAFFQLVAIALVLWIAQSNTDFPEDIDNNDAYHGLGTTFWVAVVGSVFALFDAIFLRAFVSSAGDGLIYGCICKIMTPKR